MDTRFERLLDIQAKALLKNGMCIKTAPMRNCDTICDSCADYLVESYKQSVRLEVEKAVKLLRTYGFKVEET